MAKWLTIVDAPPVVNGCTVKDTNSTILNATGNEKNCIVGYSNVTYALSALPLKGATITEVKAVCGKETLYNFNNTFTNAQSGTVTFYIKDSRGLTTTYTDSSMNTINYVKPTITKFEVTIPVDGDVTNIDTAGTYFVGSLGKQVNGCSAYYRYKLTNGGTYTDWVPMWTTQNSGKVTAIEDVQLDYTKGYTIQLKYTDRITTIYSEEKTVKALPVFDWNENGFNFNVPVTIMGEPAVYGEIEIPEPTAPEYTDYIVTQYVSGNNIVRKWNSGIAEVWGTSGSFTASISKAYGDYAFYTTKTVNMPSGIFINAPHVITHPLIAKGNGLVTVTPYAVTTSSFDCYIGNVSLAVSGAMQIKYYAIGIWK